MCSTADEGIAQAVEQTSRRQTQIGNVQHGEFGDLEYSGAILCETSPSTELQLQIEMLSIS